MNLMSVFTKKSKESEAKLKANCQMPAFSLALLEVLKSKGVLDEADIQMVHDLTDTGTEMLCIFFSACVEASELDEVKNTDEEAKQIMLRLLESARWLLKRPGVNPKMREQFKAALHMSELVAVAAELNEKP